MSLQRTLLRSGLPAVLAALLLAPSSAPADRTVDRSRHLWATVNVCDTGRNPDTIGIRGSMPGAANPRERMFMRFRVQFRTADGRWRYLRRGGDSGWVYAGRARYASRQAGQSFQFAPRAGSVLLRGVVRFEWRRGDRVVRRAMKRTRSGHRSSAGSDPRGYSAASCRIAR